MFQKASDIGSNTDSGSRIKRAVSAFFKFCTCIVKGRILFSRSFAFFFFFFSLFGAKQKHRSIAGCSMVTKPFRAWNFSLVLA